MYTLRLIRRAMGVAAALLMAATPSQVLAVASNTTVSNSATVNYDVGGVAQTAVNSNTVNFLVDKKVDLLASTLDGAAISVTPGATSMVLKFTVTNQGNDSQDFALTSTAVLTGGTTKWGGATTDAFDATNVNIFVDANANSTYESVTDTGTHIDALAAGASVTVFIVADIPGTATDGQYASYHLVAEARINDGAATLGLPLTNTVGGDTAGVDTVYADAQGTDTANDLLKDAKHSAHHDYLVSAAALGVTKTSSVVWDPVNLAVNPKAIPGARVEYIITINNTGAATATNVVLSDNLTAQAANIAFYVDGYGVGTGIEVTAPNINGGLALALTNASDVDVGDYNVTAASTVTVTGITLNTAQSAIIKFQVTIQ